MQNLYVTLILMALLSGCATKMAYLNTQKTTEELHKDKADCHSMVDVSDFKDSDLKQKKFNQCMKDKGYNVVSESKWTGDGTGDVPQRGLGTGLGTFPKGTPLI